jgi:hypothetical protein
MVAELQSKRAATVRRGGNFSTDGYAFVTPQPFKQSIPFR